MAQNRRIKVEGVRRREIDAEQLALVYWLQAKRILRERREQEAKARRRQLDRKREAEH
jgi:hypothetical protein